MRLRVTDRGTVLRELRVPVTMLCPQAPIPGTTLGQTTTQAGTAIASRERIAPDGRFIAAATARRG